MARVPGRRLLALLVLSAVALAAAAAAAAGPTPLAARLARALAVPHVDPARSAALAVDLETGQELFARNETAALAPASNEKLALTYAALVTLGPAFRIETDVLGEGHLDGSVWRGNLILQGHGDPTLATSDLQDLAAQIAAAGIARVTGRVIGDESFFDARRTAPGWKSSFYPDESPPLSALTVDRARFEGHVARLPALAAAAGFRRALRAAGVAVAGGVATARAGGLPLASVLSPPLAEILRFMDRESDNLTAELLLKQLGAVAAGAGTTAAGSAVVRRALAAAHVPLAGVRLVDGSGLSRLDRLTARALVAILEAAWADPELRETFVAALPVAGRNGTLEDRMRRAPALGNVVAKTGTTREASALSGFVKGRYVFAVLQNGHPLAYWWARRAQDRFATVLAAQ